MSIPKFIMMVGLVASGKSAKAVELAKEYDATVFSSDKLREEMFGDVNHQANNQELFIELHRRIKDCLRSGQSAIMDATNINYKKRVAFLKELQNIPCEKICIFMVAPYEECLKRNSERDRQVPEDVIKRMYTTINIPYWYEGWDDIQIVYSDNSENSYGFAINWLTTVMDYDQHNHHHKLTLGEHCKKAWRIIDVDEPLHSRNISLRCAAILHDCAKPACATYVNKKGEVTDDCHYYGHNFASAYDSLFFDGEQDKLYTAQIIQWHMHPYLSWKQSDKAMLRDKKLLGDELFEDIMRLHKADMSAKVN